MALIGKPKKDQHRYANPNCPECKGCGEKHIPYEDHGSYLIHTCDCVNFDRDPWAQKLFELARGLK
jgi:hypothetical protein